MASQCPENGKIGKLCVLPLNRVISAAIRSIYRSQQIGPKEPVDLLSLVVLVVLMPARERKSECRSFRLGS